MIYFILSSLWALRLIWTFSPVVMVGMPLIPLVMSLAIVYIHWYFWNNPFNPWEMPGMDGIAYEKQAKISIYVLHFICVLGMWYFMWKWNYWNLSNEYWLEMIVYYCFMEFVFYKWSTSK
jgi:hypothetical protein